MMTRVKTSAQERATYYYEMASDAWSSDHRPPPRRSKMPHARRRSENRTPHPDPRTKVLHAHRGRRWRYSNASRRPGGPHRANLGESTLRRTRCRSQQRDGDPAIHKIRIARFQSGYLRIRELLLFRTGAATGLTRGKADFNACNASSRASSGLSCRI